MVLLLVSSKGLIPMKMYSLLLNPSSIKQSSHRTKYTIEPPLRSMEPSNSLLLIETRLLLGTLEQSTPFVWHFSHFLLNLRGSQLLCSTFEDSIDMTNLRAWLCYHVRNHDLRNCMILSTLSISSHGFAYTNEDVFLTYKLMINPLISRRGTPLPTILNSNMIRA